MVDTLPVTDHVETPVETYEMQPIGFVETVNGSVEAFRADATTITLEIGHPVFQGDEIMTATDGAVGIVLSDDTALSMAGDSCLVLDEMVYDPQVQGGSVNLSISQGIFTFVSGAVAKTSPEAMLIHTPVASIGIRGTQLGVELTDGEDLNVVMMEEEGGLVGEVTIRNAYGVQVLNQAYQGVAVTGMNAAPGAVYTVTPAGLMQQFGTTFSTLPDVGDANPYGVEETSEEVLSEEDLAEEILPPEDAPEEATVVDDEELGEFETAAGEAEEDAVIKNIEVVGEDYTAMDTNLGVPPPPVFSPITPDDTPSPAPPPAPPVATRRDEPVPTAGDPTEVEPINTDPVAFNDNAKTAEDNVLSGQLSAADVDQDDLAFTLAPDGAPEHGSLTLGSDGSYVFEPDENFSGTDFFIYEVSDGRGGIDRATITLTVTPVADQPDLGVTDATFGTDFLPGDDTLKGSRGDDVLYGGGGDDTLDGKAGDDTLYGDGEAEGGDASTVALDIEAALQDTDTSETLSITLSGLPEGASLSAGTETDDVWTLESGDLEGLSLTLPQGYAEDFEIAVEATANEAGGGTTSSSATIEITYSGSEAGDDTLSGGSGDDVLYGGGGDDSLKGGGGEDILYGGTGDDTLKGQGGEDTFVFGLNGGSDTITDYKKGETLRFEGEEFNAETVSVNQDGRDAIITFGDQDVEVTLNRVDLDKLGYTVTQEPDAVVVVFDDVD